MSYASFERYCAHLAACPDSANERDLVRNLLGDLIDDNGLVRFQQLAAFHQTLIGDYNFILRLRTQRGVRPGGWHLFYVRYHLLLRVKTSGTDMRPRPHMTLSLAVGEDLQVGLGWDDELGKFSQAGDQLPKVFSRTVQQDPSLWRYLPRAVAADEVWAQAGHFDFPPNFDTSGAATIHLPH